MYGLKWIRPAFAVSFFYEAMCGWGVMMGLPASGIAYDWLRRVSCLVGIFFQRERILTRRF